ncbi:MAG: YabP/YqfC family sporulation protein [Clostridia bacterium]|nr:YabP/YqfC family sporulation protein [Clostridia bacterium]
MEFLDDLKMSGILSETVGEKLFVSFPVGARVENVKSVCKVSGSEIVLQLKKDKVVLRGENLKIYAFYGSDVTIKGKVFCVERCQ